MKAIEFAMEYNEIDQSIIHTIINARKSFLYYKGDHLIKIDVAERFGWGGFLRTRWSLFSRVSHHIWFYRSVQRQRFSCFSQYFWTEPRLGTERCYKSPLTRRFANNN